MSNSCSRPGSRLTLLSEETKSINLITRYLIGIDLKLGCNPAELILQAGSRGVGTVIIINKLASDARNRRAEETNKWLVRVSGKSASSFKIFSSNRI